MYPDHKPSYFAKVCIETKHMNIDHIQLLVMGSSAIPVGLYSTVRITMQHTGAILGLMPWSDQESVLPEQSRQRSTADDGSVHL